MGTETTQNLEVAKGQILESLGEVTAASGVELHTVESLDLALPRRRAPHLLWMSWPLQQAQCPPVSLPSRGPAFFMILSPLPPARLWFLWKLRTPLPPLSPGL